MSSIMTYHTEQSVNPISGGPLNHLGLSFSRLEPQRFISWIGLGLMTPGNKTLSFVDATVLNQCRDDRQAYELLKRAELLVPRGKALHLQLSAVSADLQPSVPTQLLYDELLLELESRQLATVFLASDKKMVMALEPLLSQRYPKLNYCVEALNDQYHFSTTQLANHLQQSESRVVISLLESPQQERMLSRLNRLMKDQLFIGIGTGLPDSIMELSANESTLWRRISLALRKKRHSVLLKPRQWLGYVAGWFEAKLSPQGDTAQLNLAILGSSWRARLLRTLIAVKASSFRMRRVLGRFFKRALDLIGVGAGLLLLSPMLIVVALLIKITSPGPIFYSQMRVGLRGKLFRMWKFRSMYTNADKRKAELEAQNEMAGGVLFKMKRDPRITPIGRIIRRLSIDELPQLLNVLTGEMSLVGPRPALPKEVEAYPVLARARLEVKPGLTGLWQISGRSDLPFDKQVLLDTAYVHTQSTTNDIKLIAKTIPAVVSGKGAY